MSLLDKKKLAYINHLFMVVVQLFKLAAMALPKEMIVSLRSHILRYPDCIPYVKYLI